METCLCSLVNLFVHTLQIHIPLEYKLHYHTVIQDIPQGNEFNINPSVHIQP